MKVPGGSEELFPRLRAGTFIEAISGDVDSAPIWQFPRLRAGTFIEAGIECKYSGVDQGFPRLRAGTFIEAQLLAVRVVHEPDFPAFGRGLSLRLHPHDSR